MVQIPRGPVSNNQLTTQTPSPTINDVQTFSQGARNIAEAGRVLGTVTEEFRQLDVLRKASRATVETNRQLTALEDRYLSDPNLTEMSAAEFHKESQDIINNQIATIPDEKTRLNAYTQFSGTALSKGYNVKAQGRQYDLQNAHLETIEVFDQSLKDYWASPIPENRAMIRNNLKMHYDNQMNARLIESVTYNKELADFDEKARKGRASFQRQALTAYAPNKTRRERILGAQLFIEQLNKGEYSELTSDEQQAELEAAQQFISRESQVANDEDIETQKTNTYRDLPKMMKGEISPETIDEKTITGEYYDKVTSKVISHLKSYHAPVSDSEVNIQEVARIERNIYGASKKEVYIDGNNREIDMGLRTDGTAKGLGYYGPILSPDGNFMTEVSIDVDIDGKNVSIPLLIPGLTAREIHTVQKASTTGIVSNDVNGYMEDQVFQGVIKKAIEHAKGRIKAGDNPFAEEGEQVSPPQGITVGSFTKSVRDYTPEELVNDIIETTPRNLSTGKATSLIEKSLQPIPDRKKTFISQELNNLTSAMTADSVKGNWQFPPAQKKAAIDIWTNKALQRIDALKNYNEESVRKIIDDVYREFVVAPEIQGGLGVNTDPKKLTSEVMRKGKKVKLFGIDDSDVEATINLKEE